MAAPIPPAIVCESSPGKHHAYWPVADMPLGDFKRAQQSLAALYGGDPAVCDLPRIMRLPGYTHAKGEPFASRRLPLDPVKTSLGRASCRARGCTYGDIPGVPVTM